MQMKKSERERERLKKRDKAIYEKIKKGTRVSSQFWAFDQK